MVGLLTEPYLLKPTATSLQVAWVTARPGDQHWVDWGSQGRTAASSRPILGLRSQTGEAVTVWCHQAILSPLVPGKRYPYRVVSCQGSQIASSGWYECGLPAPGQGLKILLTSDHQLKPMVAACMQKVEETVGRVDGIFFAGDMVNCADRAWEWFTAPNSFFSCLQGKARYAFAGVEYRGGCLLPYAPILPAMGNHEVVELLGKDPWFSAQVFEGLFAQEQHYYALSFGDIRLVVLSVANQWRHPQRGRFQEPPENLADPQRWGGGQRILEAIDRDSTQYGWLQQELQSPAWQQARFRIVMLHHPIHSLGDNAVPPFTDPIPVIHRDPQGQVTGVSYRYPPERDYLQRDLVPLLEQAGTHLVYYGHCHLWNRFLSPRGVHYLESSNVGNSYGAAWGGPQRYVPLDYPDPLTIAGDPGGLAPCLPSLAPVYSANQVPLPYVASNEITVFTILDTETGSVDSYRFHTRQPNSPVILFDRFVIGEPVGTVRLAAPGCAHPPG
ncbi:MAG: metallophosphoesterase family protein [Thermostichales cyanobacterium SRBZ-1_bins_19]